MDDVSVQEVPLLRWSPEEFVDAWDAGAFEGHRRVQLVVGEVWELGPMHSWHGRTVSRIPGLLDTPGFVVTAQTLPMPRSMPDPDAWVHRSDPVPSGLVQGYDRFDAAGVLLVVEVSDSTSMADLTIKAGIYAEGGVEHYWVVARDALRVHSGRGPDGYERVDVLGLEDSIALPYAPDRVLSVRELTGG